MSGTDPDQKIGNLGSSNSTGKVQPEAREKRTPVDRTMFWVYIILLVASVGFAVKIFFTVTTYSIDPFVEQKITPHSKKVTVQPYRGAILAADGSYLALAAPEYNIFMDCTIRKREFAEKKTNALSEKWQIKTARSEADWRKQAAQLCDSLAVIFPEKSSKEWNELIIGKRENKGAHVLIRKNVNYTTYLRLKGAYREAFNNADNYKTGFIEESTSREDYIRHYPYGALARRTIGNIPREGDKHFIGIEGRYNKVLRGEYGYEYLKTVDGKKSILDNDSTSVKSQNGLDILTTIDVNFQQIAHNALKRDIEESEHLWGGCAIVMDVKTGAIRAMVNLQKDSVSGKCYENKMDYAIRRSADPGSVFKAIDCILLLEDGLIPSLDYKVPTHAGSYDAGRFGNGKGPYKDDDLMPTYLRDRGMRTDTIRVIDGLKISSNNIFRELVVDNYGSNPQHYLDRLYSTGLFTDFEFDVNGLATPSLPKISKGGWNGYGPTLPTMAIGYSVTLTPLHVLTLYSGIANGGTMMRPYLIEGFMKDGVLMDGFKAGNTGRGILNGALCSKETADEVKRGLRMVVEDGTGKEILKAKCAVAGKTGTARILQDQVINGKVIPTYEKNGKKQYQATFVGFWPYEDPKYAAIMVVYSTPLRYETLYGARNVRYMKEIVDKTYQLGVLDEDYGRNWPGQQKRK